MKLRTLIFVLITIPTFFVFFIQEAIAVEEALDLDSVTVSSSALSPTVIPPSVLGSKFSILGRVDLTYELSNQTHLSPNSNNQESDKSQLKNYHFFLFLKVKVSPKIQFMGEFVGKNFFYVDYQKSDLLKLQFGQILLPFGDTHSYHHLYGGLQGYGTDGVMLPNIWSKPGLNFNWNFSSLTVDTYIVNGVAVANEASDPQLSSDGALSHQERQAEGFRIVYNSPKGFAMTTSGYTVLYWEGRRLNLWGLDFGSDYGFISRNFRVAAGIAYADIQNSPNYGYYNKRGDYLELGLRQAGMGHGEWRVRYGTYIDNSKQVTSHDVHNFNLGYKFPVDQISVLVEKQWNFEAVDETNNDVIRVMAALDF